MVVCRYYLDLTERQTADLLEVSVGSGEEARQQGAGETARPVGGGDVKALEARTSEALHRVADGLPVSEEDLDRMEGELMTVLQTKPSEGKVARRTRWDWGAGRPRRIGHFGRPRRQD